MKALPPQSSRSNNTNTDTNTNTNPPRPSVLPNPNPNPNPSSSAPARTTSFRRKQRHESDNQQAPALQSQHQPSKSKSAGLFSFAAAALNKTSSALANISEPVIRSRQTNPTTARFNDTNLEDQLAVTESSSSPSATNLDRSVRLLRRSSSQSPPLPHKDSPPSVSYAEADPSRPAPVLLLPTLEGNMHQTSSRLLRMTDDDRPFTKVGNKTPIAFIPHHDLCWRTCLRHSARFPWQSYPSYIPPLCSFPTDNRKCDPGP